MRHVEGPFTVKMTPEDFSDAHEGVVISRLRLEKVFTGALTGTSLGQFIPVGTPVKTSAGYLAVERISGTLEGRAGSFVVMHLGKMTRGAPSLQLELVPDSGTGALQGLSGTMQIRVEPDGRHFYVLDYELEG